MKKYILSALILTTIFSANEASAQKGFTKLFDGKTTDGWHTYGKTTAGERWKVEDGAIHFNVNADKSQAGDLVTNEEYGNFHLKYDWKVAPKANSGLIFFVHEDPVKYKQTYSTGLEMQVLDNDGHPDGKITKHRAGDLYDLIKSSSEPVKPVGQWNTAEIICKDGKLEQYLNGVKVVSTTLWDDNWKSLVAGSKFANWENWGTFKSGKIALQDHGDEVWYKNILIKKL
ncbi:DUF1080 domain-containing protein [Pedobacter sp. MC2016-24]|uniref:3-keto-disaccharide hydrolase n=1 Tax=Pedobacter sp. MC2016-24 TaxID=2780090 RepID=UPI00187F8571|nr:DUF1080 domain-containing protein [Pedobacter sp. MC2016-24]MBE9602838.1 DUF1080 domain-containing protein [Pedobacter sp. MC2016-24]